MNPTQLKVAESLKSDVKNWRTTIIGVLTGLVICATQLKNMLDSDPATVFEISYFLAGLTAMGFGIVAKDGDKTGIK